MAEILLCTMNARYLHPALGLRYLLANLGPLRPRAALREFTLEHRPADIAEALLADQPRIIALGVYVWNAAPMTHLVKLLKAIAPEVHIVLGGPEVSHETDDQPMTHLADVVIAGEGEHAFAQVCAELLAKDQTPAHVVTAQPPDLSSIKTPYDLYDDEDIAHRTIYVETSRGCPHACAFCLSALDHKVRRFPKDQALADLRSLLDRGVSHLKFVDRSLHLGHAEAVLDLLLEPRDRPVMAHFELVPDRLPHRLRPLIARFAPGTLQLEAGVQTFDPEVATLIGRSQDPARVTDTLTFLATTSAHVHADLVAGLPAETLDAFAAGFDRLLALGPQEIQVGILKRLRGAPIAGLADDFGLIFNPEPPYEILQTSTLDFPTLKRLKRFSQAWDRVANSGHFRDSVPLLWQPDSPSGDSPFARFLHFTDWLHAQAGRTHSIALKRLADFLFTYLTEDQHLDPDLVGPTLLADYRRGGRRDKPKTLQPFPEPKPEPEPQTSSQPTPLKRQARHLPRP
jgi:Protein of unknown function (DUF4080)/B12 binding domain/Radical SAM superfamily